MGKLKASILVSNHNNELFLNECIDSIRKQSFKNYEIIFIDDNSSDNSVSIAKKNDIEKIISKTETTKVGSFNQMDNFYKGFELSVGDIIFFLDSDDYFHTNKLESVVQFFDENPTMNIVFDLPIITKNKKDKNIKFKKKIFETYWPYIHPQSCISIKKETFQKMYNKISNERLKQFHDAWMDFRICIYSKYTLNEFNILKKNLTFYRQGHSNYSSKYKFLNKNWWRRRLNCHDYVKEYFDLNNINYKKNYDYFITKGINNIL